MKRSIGIFGEGISSKSLNVSSVGSRRESGRRVAGVTTSRWSGSSGGGDTSQVGWAGLLPTTSLCVRLVTGAQGIGDPSFFPEAITFDFRKSFLNRNQ